MGVCGRFSARAKAAPHGVLHPKFCSSWYLFFLGRRPLIFALCPCPPPCRRQSPFPQPQTSPPRASLVVAWYQPHAHPSTPLLFGIRAGRRCLALPSPGHEYAGRIALQGLHRRPPQLGSCAQLWGAEERLDVLRLCSRETQAASWIPGRALGAISGGNGEETSLAGRMGGGKMVEWRGL